MIRAEQSDSPLVDAEGRLLGYVRLFEVLAHFLRTVQATSEISADRTSGAGARAEGEFSAAAE